MTFINLLMKNLIGLFVLLLTFCFIAQASYALDIELGYRRLIPRIGVGEQEYENESGDKQEIKPIVDSTALGQSYHFGLRIEEYSIDLDHSEYEYDSTLKANTGIVASDTEMTARTEENRIGVNYHLERELAGVFAGIGISSIVETLETDDEDWVFKTYSPYFKLGADLIFGALRARYEQIYLSIGEHSVQINSFGILIVF